MYSCPFPWSGLPRRPPSSPRPSGRAGVQLPTPALASVVLPSGRGSPQSHTCASLVAPTSVLHGLTPRRCLSTSVLPGPWAQPLVLSGLYRVIWVRVGCVLSPRPSSLAPQPRPCSMGASLPQCLPVCVLWNPLAAGWPPSPSPRAYLDSWVGDLVIPGRDLCEALVLHHR